MSRLLRLALVLFLFAFPFSAFGQYLPVTPNTLGKEADSIRVEWGAPDVRREGRSELIGDYVAWAYKGVRMPMNDPPDGGRNVSFLLEGGHVVAAAVMGRVEPLKRAIRRLEKRERYAWNHWGTPEQIGALEYRFTDDGAVYEVLLDRVADTGKKSPKEGRLVIRLAQEGAWGLIANDGLRGLQ